MESQNSENPNCRIIFVNQFCSQVLLFIQIDKWRKIDTIRCFQPTKPSLIAEHQYDFRA